MKLEINSTKALSICLNNSGGIAEIFYGDKQRWNGYSGELTLVDELCSKMFSSTEAKTMNIEASETKQVFEHCWTDCDFITREIWTVFSDCISWRIEVELKPDKPERSIQIKQLFPYPYPAYHLQVWSASERFPCELEKLGGLHLYYGDACYGTVIPAVTLYDTRKDFGFTLAKPFNLKTARLAFHFKDYHSDGLEVETACLYLGTAKPAVAELLIRAHCGCWRPGLGWLYDKYPEYFNPPEPRVHELEGGFMITNPYTEDAYLHTFGKYRVKWAEIHNHFPVYGNYAPDETAWDSVILHDYPDLPVPPEKLSKAKINRHIESLHDNGIKGLLYFQCSGDAFIPYADNNFPDAIARDNAGKLIPTWKECCFVNASPGTSFHRHIERQLDKFLADYPEIDGVFLDQVCYQALDTAHQDGVTAYANKPAAMFGHSYEITLTELAARLHKQHKILWANGPFDIEIARQVDGVMSEGTSGISESHKYLCIRKPLLVHTYPTDIFKAETMLKYCLLAGASWSFGGSSTLQNPPELTEEIEALFSEYLPLLEPLLESDILLEPDPFRLPPGYKGEIFKSHDGKKLLVTMTGNSCARVLRLQLNVIRQGNALYRGNKDTEWQKLDFHDGTMDLPNNSISYTIVINLQE